MPDVARVAVESAMPSFDRLYSYLIPPAMRGVAKPGCRVRIPFGRANRKMTGLIVSVEEAGQDQKLKPLLLVLDAEPILNAEGLWLLEHLREHTFCTWFDALRVLIPAGLSILERAVIEIGEAEPLDLTPRQQSIADYLHTRRGPVRESSLREALGLSARDPDLELLLERGILKRSEQLRRRVQDDKVLMARLTEDWSGPLTERQQDVFDFLAEAGDASLREIQYYTAATRGVVDGLVKKGAAELFEYVRPRDPYAGTAAPAAPPPALSAEQRAVADALVKSALGGRPKPALLYGVTGSGKTEVFLAVAAEVVRAGKSVIVMVPEISLTSQTVRSLQARFAGRVAVLHSALSLGERMDEWRRIRNGGADIVVGTRSAVFAPLSNLGLVVMDEEQGNTYKSEKSPRYHAREVALARCRRHGALLLLCSATPSVESYHSAREGRYDLHILPGRFGDAVLPDIYLVDMNDPANLGNSRHVSDTLLTEIRYNLEHGEQTILLLNRRGYSTLIRCSACASDVSCPNCSVSMTFHAANDSLLCHYCGFSRPRPAACPNCGSEMMRYTGMGTQRLEEELSGLFPQARLLRMDMDTTMSKSSHERMFAAFEAGEYDILIGTQMVAKGLNFPKVTLVGALSADQALFADDFRGYEHAFALLTQVAGRSGRGSSPGRAFIQTWTPDHPIIRLAAAQDYPAFFEQEIRSRKLHLYPPFCTLAGVGFSGESELEVKNAARAFAEQFAGVARERYPGLPLVMLGPTPAEVLRVAGKYRYKLVLKCRADRGTRLLLREMLDWFYAGSKKVSAFIDMHYSRL